MTLRREKQVLLGQGEEAVEVTVFEMGPLDIPLALETICGKLAADQAPAAMSTADMMRLVVGDPEAQQELLRRCTSLGKDVEQVGASAHMALWDAWEEINSAFFEVLAAKATKAAALARPAPPKRAGGSPRGKTSSKA
jgi:hypothetical protein